MTADLRHRRRRLMGLLCAAVAGSALAACSSTPTRVPRLLRLDDRLELPGDGQTTDLSGAPVWQLQRVVLPAYLDREFILSAQGAHGLQALPDVRWAEPLVEAVPRVLRRDLAQAAAQAGHPVQVWGVSLPAGLVPAWRVRIDIQQLEADPSEGAVRLGAVWVATDPSGRQPVRSGQFDRIEPITGVAAGAGAVEALVAAHRRVLQRLAQAVAASSLRGA